MKLRELEVEWNVVNVARVFHLFHAQSTFQISKYVPFLLISYSPLAHWTRLLGGLCFNGLLS